MPVETTLICCQLQACEIGTKGKNLFLSELDPYSDNTDDFKEAVDAIVGSVPHNAFETQEPIVTKVNHSKRILWHFDSVEYLSPAGLDGEQHFYRKPYRLVPR